MRNADSTKLIAKSFKPNGTTDPDLADHSPLICHAVSGDLPVALGRGSWSPAGAYIGVCPSALKGKTRPKIIPFTDPPAGHKPLFSYVP